MSFKNLPREEIRNLYWIIFGALLKNPELPDMPRSCLFVCKGNVCRGPFAERFAKSGVKKPGFLKDIVFDSAGLKVSKSMPPPADAVQSARRFNVDLADHHSKALIEEMIRSFDIILAMDASNFKTLKRLFPQYENKIFLMPLYSNSKKKGSFYTYNIPDPYGKNHDIYYAAFRQIEECLTGLFGALERKQ